MKEYCKSLYKLLKYLRRIDFRYIRESNQICKNENVNSSTHHKLIINPFFCFIQIDQLITKKQILTIAAKFKIAKTGILAIRKNLDP